MGQNNSNKNGGCAELKDILDEFGIGNVGIMITFVTGIEIPSSALVYVSQDENKLTILKPGYGNKSSIQVIDCNMIESVKVFAANGLTPTVSTITFSEQKNKQ